MMTPSIWTSMYRQTPLLAALDGLRQGGWAEVEVSTEHICELEASLDPDAAIAAARRHMEKLGIAAPQAHGLLRANVAAPDDARRNEDIGRLSRHIELAAGLGVRTIVMHPGECHANPEIQKHKVRRARELADWLNGLAGR